MVRRAGVECPKHGSTFSLETGAPLTLPATQPVPVFTATVADGSRRPIDVTRSVVR